MERLPFSVLMYREMMHGTWHLVLFFLTKWSKSQKKFDKGQKVRYTLTIEKSKKSKIDVLCI